MISYFPTPYENELFYSIIARYHYHSGHKTKRETLLSLLGSVEKNFYVDVPSGVNLIAEKLKGMSKNLTVEYFVEKHSILPLFRQFMDPDKYHKVLLKVNGADKSSNPTRIIPERVDDVKRKQHLYYCRECLKDQFQTHGEGYWNRFHQISGVLVCTKHKICLTKLFRKSHNMNLNKLIIPNINDKKSDVEEIQVSGKSFEILLDIAKDIEYLFTEKLTVYPHTYYYNKYMELLKIHGIGYPMFKRKYLLAEKILDVYPKEILDLFNSYLSPEDPLCWLRYVTEEHRVRYLHPVRHILIMRLLCGSVRGFYENNQTYQPFGSGPWFCMNPLADHYLEKCVETVDISPHIKYRRLQGDFTCNCGFKYRLILPEQSPFEVNNFSQRIIERGDLWCKEFQTLLAQKMSVMEISHITNLSCPTVRRISKQIMNGKQNITVRGTGRRKEFTIEERTLIYKKQWKTIFKENPGLKRTQLKRLNPAVFSWIQSHDKVWLEKHLPPKRWKSKNGDKHYKKMDKKLLQAAQEAFVNWTLFENEKGLLQRITRRSLLQYMGLNINMVIKNSDNYPLFQGFLNSVIENRNDFQKRRIRNLLDNKFKNQIVTICKIKTLASLYIKLDLEIECYLQEQVESHNKLVEIKGVKL
ncbi:TnsD family Tn7-like transposition protein [Bacillus cereus]|nr:TnsD family Tn7-like transposition protein [Bacillus cereus]